MTTLLNTGGIAFVSMNNSTVQATAAQAELVRLGITDIELSGVELTTFACGEVKPRLVKNVRQKDVYLFFKFSNGSFNDDLMALLLTLDAIHFAGAHSITLVAPFLPYLRQDRKDEPRVPISAARMIRMIEMTPSLQQVITIDMHADQLQAVFTIPTDHLPGHVVMASWIKERFSKNYKDLVLVAPDFGSAKRVRRLARALRETVAVAILEKNRDKDGVEVLSIIGASVENKTCVINDDMMDTCGTIAEAATTLYAHGAKQVIATATHPIMSNKGGVSAYEKLEKAGLEVVVTDSLETEPHEWLTVRSLSMFLAHTILQHITKDGSVSRLIEEGV